MDTFSLCCDCLNSAIWWQTILHHAKSIKCMNWWVCSSWWSDEYYVYRQWQLTLFGHNCNDGWWEQNNTSDVWERDERKHQRENTRHGLYKRKVLWVKGRHQKKRFLLGLCQDGWGSRVLNFTKHTFHFCRYVFNIWANIGSDINFCFWYGNKNMLQRPRL